MNVRHAAAEQSVLDGSIFIIPAKAGDRLPPATPVVRRWRDHLGAARCLLARIISGDLREVQG